MRVAIAVLVVLGMIAIVRAQSTNSIGVTMVPNGGAGVAMLGGTPTPTPAPTSAPTPGGNQTLINIKDYGASGSVLQTTGTINAASHTLTLAAATDFLNGNGIEVDHAGAPCLINATACGSVTPGTPTVAAQGSTGAVHYDYKLVDLDAGGGMTAAGTAGSITNGNNVLDGVNLNHVTWTPTTGSKGKVVCRQKAAGGYKPIALVADSGAFDDSNFLDASTFYTANQAPNFFPAAGFPYVPIWALGACTGAAVADNLVTTITSGGGTTALVLGGAAGTSVAGATVNHSEDAALVAAEVAATVVPGQTTTVFFPVGSYNFFNTPSFTTSAQSSDNFDVTLIAYAVGDGFALNGLDQLKNLFLAKPSLLGANIGMAANSGSLLISRAYVMGGVSGFDDHGLALSGTIENSFFQSLQNGLKVNPYNLTLISDEIYGVPDGTAAGSPWLFKNGVLCTGAAPDGEWISATNVDIEGFTHGGTGFNTCGLNGSLLVNTSGDMFQADFDTSGNNVLVGGNTDINSQPVSTQRTSFTNPSCFNVYVDGQFKGCTPTATPTPTPTFTATPTKTPTATATPLAIEWEISAGGTALGGLTTGVIASDIAVNSGHFTKLTCTLNNALSCTTPPTINVYDGASNTGTTLQCPSSSTARGSATVQAESLAFSAGDEVGIYITSVGTLCTTDTFAVTAHLKDQ